MSCPKHSVSIIIPTYREAENIRPLVERLATIRSQFYEMEVIFVDDDSRDGIEGTIASLQLSYPWVRLMVRQSERGLSSAVIAGFKQAAYEILVCMDADLSHPPEVIPQMVNALEESQSDFVMGSRFIAGAGIYEGWTLLRWLNAWVAKALARRLVAVSDPMSGFFCLRQSTFAQADALNPIGYKIGLELMVKCHCQRIIEIPIYFDQRFKGQSKLNWRERFHYLVHLARLLKYKWQQR